jgi:hypothetical protein
VVPEAEEKRARTVGTDRTETHPTDTHLTDTHTGEETVTDVIVTAQKSRDNTVVLMSPVPISGDSGSLTVVPAGMGGDFLAGARVPQREGLKPVTMVGTHPSATVFVPPDTVEKAKSASEGLRAQVALRQRVVAALRGSWSGQKLLFVANIVCLLLILVIMLVMINL